MSDLLRHNRRSQQELLDLADRSVVLSDWARDVLVRNGARPDKVVVNRLGVRLHSAKQEGATTLPITVAYLGRFDPIKGVDDLARAIASLPPTLPVHFEFHGPVRNRSELAAITRVKALARGGAWVSFGPELDPAGVEALLSRVDLLCCPSRVVEGGPTVALEANAAGVPVIGTDLPALSEIVRDGVTGRLVPPGDWRALAAIFRELADNPAAIGRWRAALGPVRTMDDVAQEYLELYRR
jgi:glycosyltransferase involved in cell wall biosynthesis